MKKIILYYLLVAIGIILIILCFVLLKVFANPQGIFIRIPYVSLGIGSGILASGVGSIIQHKIFQKRTELKLQFEINQHDERNKALSNLAKAKSYNLMIYVFSILLLAFTLMGIDKIALLLFLLGYVFVIAYEYYCRIKFEKEM